MVDVRQFIDLPPKLIHAAAALEGHDIGRLLEHATRLKQTDGEGWAIGEMIERVVNACNTQGDPNQ